MFWGSTKFIQYKLSFILLYLLSLFAVVGGGGVKGTSENIKKQFYYYGVWIGQIYTTEIKLFPSLFGVTEGKNHFIGASHLSNIKRYYAVYRYML
jgi:hypothetical protein